MGLRVRTLLGLHVLGAPLDVLVSMGDALIWISAPPMLVLLGVLSNLGGFLYLPDRHLVERGPIALAIEFVYLRQVSLDSLVGSPLVISGAGRSAD